MRAEFDADGVLNIIPENNAESMAIKYFTDNDGKVLYHTTQFDCSGEPIMKLKDNN